MVTGVVVPNGKIETMDINSAEAEYLTVLGPACRGWLKFMA